ncbi:hypothetical protein [Wolbachia endosymbiont of Mansonella perstans]|uniref:hypothetical protein n=1 Tax=Wolbachia endosymbiont of Mansonella perstans TaxID=229526 RepID=UPI001CE157A0|nr:hypothetical protein [Wolbachia endosymbiont of Mansonella perstans]MCA4774496.1 hypothetical protein [Wolbachia endosymbiont of Mansonella perstans]
MATITASIKTADPAPSIAQGKITAAARPTPIAVLVVHNQACVKRSSLENVLSLVLFVYTIYK